VCSSLARQKLRQVACRCPYPPAARILAKRSATALKTAGIKVKARSAAFARSGSQKRRRPFAGTDRRFCGGKAGDLRGEPLPASLRLNTRSLRQRSSARGPLGGWSNVSFQARSRPRGLGACRSRRHGTRRRKPRCEGRHHSCGQGGCRPGCQGRPARHASGQARTSPGGIGLSARAMALWLPVAGASGAQGYARFAPRLTIRVPENAQSTPPLTARRMQGAVACAILCRGRARRCPGPVRCGENLAVGPRTGLDSSDLRHPPAECWRECPRICHIN
jgi:hypothetical protein